MRVALAIFFFLIARAWSQEAAKPFQPHSDAPSIEMILGKPPSKPPDSLLTIRNLSPHTMTAYCARPGMYLAPVFTLRPGEERYLSSQGLVLSAAIFDDGSYEGDVRTAAELAAYQIGEQIQFERIKRLADEVIAGPTDDDGNAALMEAKIRNLDEKAEPWMFELLTKEFPTLSGPVNDALKHHLPYWFVDHWLAGGLSRVKWHTINNKLAGFKFLKYDTRNPRPTLYQWWNQVKQEYDQGWGEMSQKVTTDLRCQDCQGHATPMR